MAAYGYLRYLLSCSAATPSHISDPLPCVTNTIFFSKLLKMLLLCDRLADASHVNPVAVTFVRGNLKSWLLFKKPEASTISVFKSTTSSFQRYPTPPTRQPHPTMSPSYHVPIHRANHYSSPHSFFHIKIHTGTPSHPHCNLPLPRHLPRSPRQHNPQPHPTDHNQNLPRP